MQQEDRSAYRLAAAECMEMAQAASDPSSRGRLTLLAGKFLDLANLPDSDAAFAALVGEFNKAQMRTKSAG